MPTTPTQILKNFGLNIQSVTDIGSGGGFSGANLWQVQDTSSKTYCLRRWPTDAKKQHLEWLHLVLGHVRLECPFVAAPIEPIQSAQSVDGSGLVFADGHFFELAPWMPGTANFHSDPTDQKLAAAMTALAKFHLAAAQVNLDFQVSKNVSSRLAMLDDFQQSLAAIKQHSQQLRGGESPAPPLSNLKELSDSLFQFPQSTLERIATQLKSTVSFALPHQPAIRDVWHDHVLFTDDEVTGLVDFGAMQMESIAFDLSRLLGSLVGHEPERYDEAINVYQQTRPLMEPELRLIRPLDQASIVLSGMNWLKWIVVDRKTFPDWLAVDARLAMVAARIRRLTEDSLSL